MNFHSTIFLEVIFLETFFDLLFIYFVDVIKPIIDTISDYAALIAILVTIIITCLTYIKHLNLSINNQRLELVYFPLISKLQNRYDLSYNEAYISYLLLKDNLKNEKFKSLINPKIIQTYLLIKDCYSIYDDQELALKYTKKLIRQIDIEYNKIKRTTGYMNNLEKKIYLFFGIWYISFLLMTLFMKIDSEPSILLAFGMLIIFIIFFVIWIIISLYYFLKKQKDILFIIRKYWLKRKAHKNQKN